MILNGMIVYCPFIINNSVKLIGLTGGIGSGKSTVAHIFKLLGVPVYYADQRAKHLMETNPQLQNTLISYFGQNAFTHEGKLNSSLISSAVFSDPAKLHWLNQQVHPYVGQDLYLWAQSQTSIYGIVETALIRETQRLIPLKKIIVVTAAEKLRIQRTMQRDRSDVVSVKQRMAHQLKEDEWLKVADYVVVNDQKFSLIRQCVKIHQSLTAEFVGNH